MSAQSFKVIGEGSVEIGEFSTIGEGVVFIFNKPGKIVVGDYCFIGADSKFVLTQGDIKIGDWVSIHDRALVLSSAGVSIGSHCWFGQGCVLDGTGGLMIEDGVRVGMYSQIWSHAAAGEQIEGCTLFVERPVKLCMNVWLIGSCIVGSGVTIGERTTALIGSNITKSVGPNLVIAGAPAQVKPGLSFYKELTLEQKWLLLIGWISDAEGNLNVEKVLEINCIKLTSSQADEAGQRIIFVKDAETYRVMCHQHVDATICCVETKKYTKRCKSLEYRVLKYLSANKARFYS